MGRARGAGGGGEGAEKEHKTWVMIFLCGVLFHQNNSQLFADGLFRFCSRTNLVILASNVSCSVRGVRHFRVVLVQ